MFIQTKCNELSFADLIRATKDTIDESKKFPYKTFVSRCGNCQFCYKGKCSLKECCCMGERVKAGSCSFTELLNHCFRNIGDCLSVGQNAEGHADAGRIQADRRASGQQLAENDARRNPP